MSVHRVQIVDASTKELVEGELRDELSPEDLLDIEDQWGDPREQLRQRRRDADVPLKCWPQSLHWDWSRKSLMLTFGDPDDFRIFGVMRESVWEGAMVTLRKSRVARLAPDIGKSLIYVDYLEAAPWNWTVKEIGQLRKFKAVGPLLLRAALAQSEAEGSEGRVGLHALPQAEEFYKSLGFVRVTMDALKRLPYYELTSAAAKTFMR
jgi:hypothetical protein